MTQTWPQKSRLLFLVNPALRRRVWSERQYFSAAKLRFLGGKVKIIFHRFSGQKTSFNLLIFTLFVIFVLMPHLKFVLMNPTMRKILLLASLLICIPRLQAQLVKANKYPSLLWEISGKGLKKPSYLIGTMHVSNKLAFNLPDSFYLALRSCDVVALENNPESWQEDMSRYEIVMEQDDATELINLPSQYLSQSAIKFYRYYGKLQRALSSNPSSLNNLLYRNYGNESSDFEEDTYLDMYIFQCGKKWGKRIAGVESYGQSMRLMMEAYKDAAQDKKKKDRSYGDLNGSLSNDKLQEAYRTGNLDLLDSINRYNSSSEAFDEKFIYRRNEIQAHSIDSIIRSGSSLFVGVGAAHLPGNRGVIELLRSMGYKLRPVKMGERASKQKDLVDKIRVPVIFHTETAEDGAFTVDVPGKLYRLSEDAALKQQQFADMGNGSYYMVTRLMTNAWMWNQDNQEVLRKVDSLLYEHIPGKIISRAPIQKNGYQGYDILNRTRRGDLQRYNIFVTPFEVMVFKMSGTGEYVKQGSEAEKFFGSIKLKEYKSIGNNWVPYSPSFGGFSIQLPHEPYTGNDGSWIFDASDNTSNNYYRVIRTDVSNYHFLEEDSFDLGLLNESFKSSAFIKNELEIRSGPFHGYPSMDGKYMDKYGQLYFTRFILQGQHYYTLIAKAPAENEEVRKFMNSFEIMPFKYGSLRTILDTSLYFTVNSPVYTDTAKTKLTMPRSYWSSWSADEGREELTEKEKLMNGLIRSKTFQSDSTGEQISVTFFQTGRYFKPTDRDKVNELSRFQPDDTTMILLKDRTSSLPTGYQLREAVFTDTNSSRRLWSRTWFRPETGTGYALVSMTDSTSQPSEFLQQFFQSFQPLYIAPTIDAKENGSVLFFKDLFSGDSTLHKRALRNLDGVSLDSSDTDDLVKAIHSLNWNEKKYLDLKITFINMLGEINTSRSADLLERSYQEAGDTLQLQYAALENLLQHCDQYSFALFRKIMVNDPPVLEMNHAWSPLIPEMDDLPADFDNGSFLDELYDSLALTKTILPDLLPLLNLKDYERPMMELLKNLLDQGLIGSQDYKEYFNKFFIEAKQELKKQAIAEKKKAIDKAEKDREENTTVYTYDDKDAGNDDLSLYATLLLPFESQNNAVGNFIQQLLRSGDRRLVLNTALLLIKNKKSVSDSILRSLAGMDEFRFELYSRLKELDLLRLFPSGETRQVDLARSALLAQRSYDKPDTLAYLDKRPVNIKGLNGYVFFFKYKMKSVDLNWKIATIGLVPVDTGSFKIDILEKKGDKKAQLTGFRAIRLKEDKPMGEQLDEVIKKWLIARRKSGKDYYPAEDDNEDEDE